MSLKALGPIRLPGAVALITGAAQGIGLQTATRLRDHGARVVLVDIDQDQLDEAVTALGQDSAAGVLADVRDCTAMVDAVEQAVATFGRLDVVVANAGVTPPTGTFRTIAPGEFRRVVEVNLLGVANTVQASIEHIIASRGHIQVIGSCAAFAPGMGGAAYMISKAGVEQLGRALRIELSPHRASVGMSYFGLVDTALARATLDDDPVGRQIGAMLPWPLNTRIDAARAAECVVGAIEKRRATTIAPKAWVPYSWLRGIINPILDARMTRDGTIDDIIRQIEA